MDMAFYDKLPKLFPHADARSWFLGKQEFADDHRVSQLEPAGRLLHPRGARPRPRLRADERLRPRQDRRRVLGRHRDQDQLHLQSRPRRPDRSCSRAARGCRSTRPAGSSRACYRPWRGRRSTPRARSTLAGAPAGAGLTALRLLALEREQLLELLAALLGDGDQLALRPCGAAPSPRSCSTLWRRKRSARLRAWCGSPAERLERAARRSSAPSRASRARSASRRARAARSSAARCGRARRSSAAGSSRAPSSRLRRSARRRRSRAPAPARVAAPAVRSRSSRVASP